MKTIDEDSTLSVLASAWVNLATVRLIVLCIKFLISLTQGGAKDQEAAYTFEELIDKHGGSALLLNGLAVAKMHLGQFEAAEGSLQEALIKA